MSEVKFLTPMDAVALHEQVMAASQQAPAALVRPESLESAVHSARNLAWYEGASLSAIAVHLTIHIALAHPWVDGNKRTASTLGIILLRLNGARQATATEALEFGKLLIKYIEAEHDARESVLDEFVGFVDGWFGVA